MNGRRAPTAREVLLEVFGEQHAALIDASLEQLNMFDVQRHVEQFFSQFNSIEAGAADPPDAEQDGHDDFANFDPEDDVEEEDESLKDVF